jgi:hypothetical protein
VKGQRKGGEKEGQRKRGGEGRERRKKERNGMEGYGDRVHQTSGLAPPAINPAGALAHSGSWRCSCEKFSVASINKGFFWEKLDDRQKQRLPPTGRMVPPYLSFCR